MKKTPAAAAKKAPLFDDLVGSGEQPFGHVQHPRSLEANSKVFQKSPPDSVCGAGRFFILD
jgi:hypothetical protein